MIDHRQISPPPYPKYDWVCNDATPAPSGASPGGVPARIASLLNSRGVEARYFESFLNPELRRDMADPIAAFPEMERAAVLIWDAVRGGTDIVVFSDYDADGVCAGAIVIRTLKILGATASSFIPDRKTEGFGFSQAAAERCLKEHSGAGLWITVDCGIAYADEIASVKARGVKVIVTDHHEPTGKRPQVDALVNPRVECRDSRLAELCGAGVAFKLAQTLVDVGRKNGWYDGGAIAGTLLPLAALATVADSVPLLGENRLIVRSALKYWPHWASAGMRALQKRMSGWDDAVSVRTLGFSFAPCINSAGRIGSAERAMDLLLEDDECAADAIAQELVQCNSKRQECERRISEEAKRLAAVDDLDTLKASGAVVVSNEVSFALETGWHPGVVGIVASRLCELTRLPTAIATIESAGESSAGRGHGSVRVPEGYDAVQALAESAEALEAFGGHVAAAGFSIRPGQELRFKELFCAACRRQAERKRIPSRPQLKIDAVLSCDELTSEFCRGLEPVMPFGLGNPEPRWVLEDASIADLRIAGKTGSTLLFKVLKSGKVFPAIWFGAAANVEFLRTVDSVDVAFSLWEDARGAQPGFKLCVVDVRPHGGIEDENR